MINSINCQAKQCPNPFAMKVNTNFNLKTDQAASMKIILELIPGVEEIHFGHNKYEFLVVIGEMFDFFKIAEQVVEKVEDFVKDNQLIQ